MSINSDKTIAILFGDKSAIDINPIRINDQVIKWKNTVKYPGITLDLKLTLHQHIKHQDTQNQSCIIPDLELS